MKRKPKQRKLAIVRETLGELSGVKLPMVVGGTHTNQACALTGGSWNFTGCPPAN